VRKTLIHEVKVRPVYQRPDVTVGPKWWYAYSLPNSRASTDPLEVEKNVRRDLNFEIMAYGISDLGGKPL
jgi:hypothetical protein